MYNRLPQSRNISPPLVPSVTYTEQSTHFEEHSWLVSFKMHLELLPETNSYDLIPEMYMVHFLGKPVRSQID